MSWLFGDDREGMGEEWTRGRELVVRIGWVLIAIEVAVIVSGTGDLPVQIVRYGILLFLLYFLARGYGWARWTLGVLLLIGGGMGLLFAAALMGTTPWAWALLVMGGAYLYCVGLLVASGPVRAFFAAPVCRASDTPI